MNNFSLSDGNSEIWMGSIPERKKPILAVKINDGEFAKVASFDTYDKYLRFVIELKKLFGEPLDEEQG